MSKFTLAFSLISAMMLAGCGAKPGTSLLESPASRASFGSEAQLGSLPAFPPVSITATRTGRLWLIGETIEVWGNYPRLGALHIRLYRKYFESRAAKDVWTRQLHAKMETGGSGEAFTDDDAIDLGAKPGTRDYTDMQAIVKALKSSKPASSEHAAIIGELIDEISLHLKISSNLQ